MIHLLKCEQEYFNALTSGNKTFEIRNNDRNFELDDFLVLTEIVHSHGEALETGRFCIVRITYLLDAEPYVPNGYVAIGFRSYRLEKGSRDVPPSYGRYRLPRGDTDV